MNIADIQAICKKLPGVTQDIKWENHLCFNIGGKMFVITSPDTFPVTASFKVSAEDFDILENKEGFKASPYLARYKWIHVDDIKRLSKKEWNYYLKQSHSLIAAKLPVKIKKQLKLV